MTTIADRLARVRSEIYDACVCCGRDPGSVTLVAVSKAHPAAAIRQAFEAGQRVFGESYPLEFRDKCAELADLAVHWHFVGHIQRNKMKVVAGRTELVHSLSNEAGIAAFDRRIAALDKQAYAMEFDLENHPPGVSIADVLLQVNLSGETTKRGCTEAEVDGLVAQIAASEHLRLRGMMTLPPPDEPARPYFARLRALRDRLAEADPAIDVLSMGMTADFRDAIAEGATHIRIGTAIFGPRTR